MARSHRGSDLLNQSHVRDCLRLKRSVAGCALTARRPPARPRRFALPHPHQPLGLPIGQHISLRAEDEDSGAPMLLRPYTPVSTLEQTGLVDFVIKARARPRPDAPPCPVDTTKLQRSCTASCVVPVRCRNLSRGPPTGLSSLTRYS